MRGLRCGRFGFRSGSWGDGGWGQGQSFEAREVVRVREAGSGQGEGEGGSGSEGSSYLHLVCDGVEELLLEEVADLVERR